MAFSACKIPINDGLRADMEALKSRVETFETMSDAFLNDATPEVDGFYKAAIAIDTGIRKYLQEAISQYDKLNLAIGESV